MKPTRWLDVAIKVVLVLVVALGAYLGYSVWSHDRNVDARTPAGRVLTDLEAAVRKKPNDPNLRVALGQALVANGRRDQAVDQYREALRIDKKHTGALLSLGVLAMQERQFDTAEGHWRKLIDTLEGTEFASKDNRLEQGYFYLGQTLIEQKRHQEAVGYLKEALRIRPDASDTHYSLAVAYRELDSVKKQRQELETTLAFDPMMPEANYDLGILLLAEGDTAGAAERFRLSADRAPNGVDKPRDALKELGDADERFAKAKSLAASDPKAALVEGRIAMALDPQRADIIRFVAGQYEKAGKKKEAKDLFQQLLDRDASDADAKKAIERLSDSGK